MVSKTQPEAKVLSQTCMCPSVQGGAVTCDADQLAICRVRRGVIETSCASPPSTLVTRDEVRRWCFGQITQKPKSGLTEADESMLDSGTYMDFASGSNTRFHLPVRVQEAGVESLMQDQPQKR